jgi:hypothetical protein
MEKTKVKIIGEHDYRFFKIGDRGYIDGYIKGGDDRPCAVVIVGGELELVPI